MPRKLPNYLPADWPDCAQFPSLAEWERAVEDDRIVGEALEKAMENLRQQMTTPDSIAAGDAAMFEAHIRAAETIVRRIEGKELLSRDEFCEAAGVTCEWLSDALTDGRLFAIAGPRGRSFFPSFYADSSIERTDIERVARVLSPLHPTSQYWFFTSVRTSLHQTPLDALRAGRLDAVVASAQGHADGAPPRVLSVVEEIAGQSEPLVPPRHDPSDSFTDVLNGTKRR